VQQARSVRHAGLFIRTLHYWAERFGAFVIRQKSPRPTSVRSVLIYRKDFRSCL